MQQQVKTQQGHCLLTVDLAFARKLDASEWYECRDISHIKVLPIIIVSKLQDAIQLDDNEEAIDGYMRAE